MTTFLKFFKRWGTLSNGWSAAQEELFLFVHLPKTGGQTLRNFFSRHLVFHQEFIHLGPYGLQKAQELNLLPFEQRSAQERRLARVILGHYVTKDTHTLVSGKTARHVLFLREPAQRLLSHYNSNMHEHRLASRPIVDFEAWYNDTKRGNMMTRWVYVHFMQERDPGNIDRQTLAKVMKALKAFWFVGCTEFLDHDAPLLFKRIGVQGTLEPSNFSGVRFPKVKELDPALRERLNHDNPLDLELYQYWKDKIDESRERVAH
jgi:hypothetical protein